MLERKDISQLYTLILDRPAESDAVLNEKRTAGSLKDVALEMFMSEEFIHNNESLLKRFLT